MAPLPKDEWKDRIAPVLSVSLDAVSDRIMQAQPVQSWLRDASTEAAEALNQPGMQGAMQGYSRMMDELEETLPNLLTAVEELTEGCGSVELDWNSTQPNRSRLYISFDCDYTLSTFVRLETCSMEAVQEAIDKVVDALPDGEPFPKRPNQTTGLIGRDGRSIGLRVKEYLREDGTGTVQRLTLLPSNQQPLENLSRSEAARQTLQVLCAARQQ